MRIFPLLLLFALPARAEDFSCRRLRSHAEKMRFDFKESTPNQINCGAGTVGSSNFVLPTDPDATYEMHVIGVHDGGFPPRPGDVGPDAPKSSVQILVYKTIRPAVVVLSAHKPVLWEMKVTQEADLALVILQGNEAHRVSGLPDGVPIRRRPAGRTCGYGYKWERHFHRYGENLRHMLAGLRCATGLRETSFQGCETGAVFEIPHYRQKPPAPLAEKIPPACPIEVEAEIPLGVTGAPPPEPKPLIKKPPKIFGPAEDYERALAEPEFPDRGVKLEPPKSPEPKRKLGRRETLPAPKGAGMKGEIPVRALAILLEGDRSQLTHDAIPDLIVALEKGNENLRSRAADALGQLVPPAVSAVEGLMKAMRDDSDRVRASAALALGNIGPGAERAVKILRKALKDPNPDVRYSAETSLERIGTEKALKALKSYRKGSR